MYIYVCIHICIYMYMYTRSCIYTYVYTVSFHIKIIIRFTKLSRLSNCSCRGKRECQTAPDNACLELVNCCKRKEKKMIGKSKKESNLTPVLKFSEHLLYQKRENKRKSKKENNWKTVQVFPASLVPKKESSQS